MRNYVVLARFNEEKERQIMELRDRLVAEGYSVPEWPPHITLAAYENIDEASLCEWTNSFCSSHTKIKVAIHSLNILPPGGKQNETAVLCFAPAHSKTFVDFYYAFHEKHEEYCTGIGWFNSIVHGNPVVHSTIGIFNVKELQKAMEIVFTCGIFGEAEITALEIYTYPMQLIRRYSLM